MSPAKIEIQKFKEYHTTSKEEIYVPDARFPLEQYCVSIPVGSIRTRFNLQGTPEVLFPGDVSWERLPSQQEIGEKGKELRVRTIFADQDGLLIRTEIIAVHVPIDAIPSELREFVEHGIITRNIIAHNIPKIRRGLFLK